MKKIFKITFSALLLFLTAVYLGIVFVLPPIINSKPVISKLESLIHAKTGIETNITGLNFKISPALLVVFKLDCLDAKNNDVSVADIKNLSLKYKLLQKHLTFISADNIFIDGNYLKQFKKEGKNKKKKGKFELKKIPELHISNFVYNSDEVNILLQNADTINDILQLNIAVNAPFLKETLTLGDSGTLEVTDNKFKANQFEVKLGNSHLFIDGYFLNKDDFGFDINGEELPVSEIMPMLLHFQKSKDPSKKFLENFKNFKGTAKLNLKLNKDGIWGTGVGNNLSANAVWFDIPLYFKEAVFNFKGQTIDSVAQGILGNEKVTHTLNITDLLNPQKKLVVGTMNTTLTKKFKFVPGLTILNSVNANLVYKIKDRKPDVYYDIDIPANSDLIFKSFYLGLRDYKRKLHANTFKDNNDLYLREYKYSYFTPNKENVILYGDALFMKHVDKANPDKFIPQYLNVRTNGYAPTSVIGSFGEKVQGGEFKGDLNYDFKNNQVLGTFDIIKAKVNDFNIEKAGIVSKNGVFNITSDGFFKGQKYMAELNLKNNIFGETHIYNMKLFLDKLIFETTQDAPKENQKTEKEKPKTDSKEFSDNVKSADITIDKWVIIVNEIRRDKFFMSNVKLLGSMKKNVFTFNMDKLNFADGTINANGVYDFNKDTANMSFVADNINSDKAASMMLNLQDQIEGIANAKVNLKAKDMFKYIDANCSFEVKEGFMPKMGDAEFTINKTKYKLSEITNVDLTQKDEMKDDIKGSFDVHNTELNNIDITTWHELSAMYLTGNYEMEKQYADLHLFWHYSKEAPKGARIFGIPLSLILKVVFRPEFSKKTYEPQLQHIPAIKDGDKNSNYYRIMLKGDINNNKTELVMKEIR